MPKSPQAAQTSGLWLVRHGSLHNPTHSMIGASDLPLSDLGRTQMRNLGREIRTSLLPTLKAIVTSDLSRCLESTKLLLENSPQTLPIHVEPRLREISLGRWEGLTKSFIKQKWPRDWLLRGQALASYVPDNGESFRMLARRAVAAIDDWLRQYPEGYLLIVTHAGVLRCLLARHLSLPLDDILHIPLDYASIFYLPRHFADHAHLDLGN